MNYPISRINILQTEVTMIKDLADALLRNTQMLRVDIEE